MFGTNFHTKDTSTSLGSSTPVRVVDVILSEDHPEYDVYGQRKCIGAIKYEEVDRAYDPDLDPKVLPIAYPLHPNSKTIPLKNEVVLIVNGPSEESSQENASNAKVYYSTIVNVWRNPNSNPVYKIQEENTNLGDFPDEGYNVNPIHPYPGDTLLEGRFGQSIRMSGAGHYKNIYSNSSNNGKPFMILRNGQKETDNSLDLIEEDINKDKSSMYFMSDHSVPLEEARTKAETYQVPPDLASAYKGPQVILNSGRLFFNAQEEGIYFSAKDDFGISAESVHIDGVSQITLDAKKIHLGVKAMELEFEPVIKGDQLEMLLYSLLNELKSVGSAMAKAKTIKGHAIPTLNMEGRVLKKIARQLGKSINPGGKSDLKSTKVYTE